MYTPHTPERPYAPSPELYTVPWSALGPPEHTTALSFDPEPFALLLDEQWAAWPALAQAMRRCTTQWVVDDYSSYLLDPALPEASAPYTAYVTFNCPQRGKIGLTVVASGAIAELDLPEPSETLDSVRMVYPAFAMPPFTVVHRSWDVTGS